MSVLSDNQLDGQVSLEPQVGRSAAFPGFALEDQSTWQIPISDTANFLAPAQVFAAPDHHLDLAGQNRAQASAASLTYHWHIPTDIISWSSTAPTLLGVAPDRLSTGKTFASLLDNQNFTSRYDTVMHGKSIDAGNGVAFEIEYMLRPNGRDSDLTLWVEDTGKWFADDKGNPTDVYGVMRKVNERHDRDQHLSFLSNCDPLTGMMNRNRMQDALGEAISVATAEKMPGAFAIIAINNLAVMNEAYGFDVADEVVVELGQRLRQVMRLGDGIARYSGSKFGIILNSCKAEELNFALERFMRAVRDSVIETRHGPVWALLSIGAVSLPALGNSATEAIAHAEEALSESFRLPTDGYVVYATSTERKTKRLLNARCATEIVECLEKGLFKLAYQPVYDACSGELILHEALLRMADSTGAMITAGHLVPIAERLGLIRLIDRAVLQMALSTLQVHPEARLSINISATTANDPRWNVQLIEMIAAAKDLAPRLVIELTETTELGDLETSHAFLSALQRHGCGVALDDFGAGYTSYRNLMQLPLSMIKLDGSFCVDIAHKTDNQIFVKSMVGLARSFGLKLVAEWVENEPDAQMLRNLGVDYLQGNHFGEASVEAPWAEKTPTSFAIEELAAEASGPETLAVDTSPSNANAMAFDLPAPILAAPVEAAAEIDAIEVVEVQTTETKPDGTAPTPVLPEIQVSVSGQVAAAEPEAGLEALQESSDESLGLLKSLLAELSAAIAPHAENRLAS